MRSVSPQTLVSLAVASGATIPVPSDGAGAMIWSSTTNSVLVWNGSQWSAIGSGGSGDVVGPASATDNAIARFDLATGKLIQSSLASVDDNGTGSFQNLLLPAQGSEPAAPASGNGLLYSKALAGRTVPRHRAPSGSSYALSPHLGGSNVRAWRGGATTAASTFAATIGAMPYTSASPIAPTTPALAATNLLTQTYRSTLSTGATAGGLAYIRGNGLTIWRGNAAGLGGFLVIHRFALSGTLQAGLRAFAGIVDVAANPTNVDPTSTATPGGVGIAVNGNTGNWKLVNNVTDTARTASDLGANFPVINTDLLELALSCMPNDSGISYQVTNLSTGNTTGGTLTTNIPANTSFLAPAIWTTNNATGAAQTLDFISTYVETDY